MMLKKCKDEFEEARIEYNSRQIRDDRKIQDYFTHVSDNSGALDEENYDFLINKNKSNNSKEISMIETEDFKR